MSFSITVLIKSAKIIAPLPEAASWNKQVRYVRIISHFAIVHA